MTGEDDSNEWLLSLQDALVPLVEPRGSYVAMTEEVLRSASGGEVDRFNQIQGDVWMSQALPKVAAAFEKRFDYNADSLQKRLLHDMDRNNPDLQVWELFEKAKEVRRKNCNELASKLLAGMPYSRLTERLGKSVASKLTPSPLAKLSEKEIQNLLDDILAQHPTHTRSKDRESGSQKPELPPKEETTESFINAREFAWIRLATLFPEEILPGAGFREMVNMALLGGRGKRFLMEVGRAFENHENAKKVCELTPHEVVMSVHFTNPNFPLWLAEAPALINILMFEFGLDDLSKSNDGKGAAEKRLRNRKLKCDSPYPILGMEKFSDGRVSFTFSKGILV